MKKLPTLQSNFTVLIYRRSILLCLFFCCLLSKIYAQPGPAKLYLSIFSKQGQIQELTADIEVYCYTKGLSSGDIKINSYTLNFTDTCMKIPKRITMEYLIAPENIIFIVRNTDTMKIAINQNNYFSLFIDSLVFSNGSFELKNLQTAVYKDICQHEVISGKNIVPFNSLVSEPQEKKSISNNCHNDYLKIKAINENTSNEEIAVLFHHTDFTYNGKPFNEHQWDAIHKELFCGKSKNNKPWNGVIELFQEQGERFVPTNFIKPVKNGKIQKKVFRKPS